MTDKKSQELKNTKTSLKELNLPSYSFRFKSGDNNKALIYDELRRKYVVLTPEEWVRQHFVQYLINEKDYPAGLLGIEVMFKMNRLVRRADILAYSRDGRPLMIVECKAPEVKISEKVFDQIINYNMQFRLNYIIMTNGVKHYACITDLEKNSWSFLKDIPSFNDLS